MSDDTNAVDLIMSAIKERTVSDSEFRDALIKNPKETLEAAGIDLADCDAINIIDGEPNHLNIVLPPAAGALSDSELDSVAGGAVFAKLDGYSRMLPKLKVDAGRFGSFGWSSRGRRVDVSRMANSLGDLAV